MQEHTVVERIKRLCASRSWTYYRLAKESGIAYSTLCTMLHKTNAPSFSTLTRICDGFGMTLSQFFSEDVDVVMLTEQQKEHLHTWSMLTKENQAIVEKYIQFLLSEQENG